MQGFPHFSVSKESDSNAGDLGSIPGSGRCPGEGNGNPLQYSCLENPMDSGAWQTTVYASQELDSTELLSTHTQGFPGGPMVKNPACNARDTSSIPDPGRFHIPQENLACMPQPLSPLSTTAEALMHALEPGLHKRSCHHEKPSHCN